MHYQNQGENQLLCLLQLASPALPVGAYSYSEGIEVLVTTGKISDYDSLKNWLIDCLKFGSIRLEAALIVRAYLETNSGNLQLLNNWNNWATAVKETEELRLQSLQMGRTLIRLFTNIQPDLSTELMSFVQKKLETETDFCNFAIAYGLISASWQIEIETAILGYLHSWATNLVNAGVKLIPLGQTVGQKLLWELQNQIVLSAEEILKLKDDELNSCSWGLSLASMVHEVQYTRLFRS
ncbi:MAG: urease accessory protein UreF [Okeania sp. SIO2G4]|uniref:urease accessory protein UreF n=1 Tax=unclassified Okeania TaxID=2634635 RepID=UPI0013BC7817|nr:MULTISPECIES: urease accessory protein UreF [unclassified Okeania]NEP07160.1 urease accessory protein UreF [Okeania sp. SIO4D6]NEP41714.1 urease accessory protein UreF [Okeania sp. SIO2H7]NEP73262.1 urease accessory protein UreF [Okeania sp. SIO2G5]NEP94127.1 urease accessory protein UreF [Okeania sp. SIO2F5]NEQ91957.1 urease accessory protein UreF [Okeania sp. SIO2G4]